MTGAGNERLVLVSTETSGVGTLTLNRPARANAFNQAMLEEWAAGLTSLLSDDAVRVVVVTGAGRAFCSGGDVEDVLKRSQEGPVAIKDYFANYVHRIADLMAETDKPVIAALNGAARSGGLDMALMCDIRIAAEGATFAEGYVNLGLIAGGGGAFLLPRLVGHSRALELFWTGDVVTASEAAAIGLVNRVVPDDQLMPAALQLARRIAAQPPLAVRYFKRAVYQGMRQTFDIHLDMVSSHLAILRSTSEHQERLAAIVEQRKKR